MKKYDSYKESGIEWIGEIPSHWEIKPLKRLACIRNGQDHKKVWDENGDYPIVGTGGIFGKANQYLCKGPSVILGRKGTIDKPQFIEEPFWSVDTAYFTEINETVNPRLFFYLCSTILFDLYKYGSAVPSMTREVLNQVPLSIASDLEEQTAIASFLDRKTAAIDELIADKKRLLDFYEEEKKALINDLVTGKKVWNGHKWTPPAKVKDSGIEWLGEIPEHWVCKKLRYLCKITTGDKDTENREDVGGYPFFIRSQTVERISTFSFDGEGILTAGDGVGVCKVWHYVNEKFDFHQRVYLMFDFAQIKGKLLFHYMKENFIHDALRQSAKSTVDSLRRTMFLNFRVSFPQDIEEQNRLVKQIESELFRVDTQVNHTQRLIDLLTEYRIALISEVVTGRIKVMD